MRFTTEHHRLGLLAIDIKIITYLDRSGSEQSYPLACALGEKRTTVDYRLRRLVRLQWLQQVKRGARVAYDLTPEARELVLSAAQGIAFDQYASLSELLVAVRKVVVRRDGGRLYFIEPSGIAEATLLAMGDEYAVLQTLIKKSGKVAEGIIGTRAVKNLSAQTWATLHGRLFDLYTVDDALLAFEDIIWVADDTTFLVNPKAGRFRALRDASFACSMRALVGTLKIFGTKINPHLYV